ncbi:MAG: LytTR family DNA-binding domain-containing protein [Candidatus Gastranaerophilales bacterium]|nr:LytTR family DNA-binding domain-containing protein [Candidatus Gastranaerophilales bacterium]
MINIAIIDDDQEFLDRLEGIVQKYMEGKEVNAKADFFSSAAQLLACEMQYDLYLLDVEMPEMDGMTLAGRLREKFGGGADIVFITIHDQAVYTAFQYDIYGFIRKTYLEKDFEETMERFIKKWINKNKVFPLKTKIGVIYKAESDIIYAEKFGHEMILYCVDGKYILRSSIEELAEKVQKAHFVKPYKGYLVNCLYIKKIETDQIILDDGRKIPVSRRSKNEAQEVFFAYLNKG